MARSRKSFVYLLLLFAIPLVLLGAGDEIHWTPLGPGGGGNSFAWGVSPVDPNIVLVGTDVGGIFRSADGGVSWLPKNQVALRPDGFAAYGMGPTHFTFNPPGSNQSVVYLGARKSTDAGNTWNLNVDEGSITTSGNAIDSTDATIVYAYGYATVYRSSDAFEGTSCTGSGDAPGTQCSDSGKTCRKGMKCYQSTGLPLLRRVCDGTLHPCESCIDDSYCNDPAHGVTGNHCKLETESAPQCVNYDFLIHGLIVNSASLLACTDRGFFTSTNSGETWSMIGDSVTHLPAGLPGLCAGGSHPGTTCKINSDCAGGTCDSGICGGSDKACTSDTDCQGGDPNNTQTCQGLRCGGSGFQCLGNSSCPSGQVCKSLSCTSMTKASNGTIYATLQTHPFRNDGLGATGQVGTEAWVDTTQWQGGVYKSTNFGQSWTEANGVGGGVDLLADKNPGFESPLGTPGPNFAWVIPSGDVNNVSRVSSSTDPVHSGSYSIKFRSTCSGGSNNGLGCDSDANCPGGTCTYPHHLMTPNVEDGSLPASSLLQVTGGTLYKISAWYKVINGSTYAALVDVLWFKSDRTRLYFPGKHYFWVSPWYQNFPNQRSYETWQKFETLVRAPDGAQYAGINFDGGLGTIYVDDVSFQATQDLPRVTGRGESAYIASYGDVAVPPGDTTGNVAYVSTLPSTTGALEGTDATGIWGTVDGGSHWTLLTRAQWHDNIIDDSRYEPAYGDGVCGGRWENCNTSPGDCARNVCSGGDNDGYLCRVAGDCPNGSCLPPSGCCGDGSCTSGESRSNCPVDCDQKTCVGGTNNGNACSVDTDCPPTGVGYCAGDHDPNRLGHNENCAAVLGTNATTWHAFGCNSAQITDWTIGIGVPPGGTIPSNVVLYSGNQHLKSTNGGLTWEDMTSSAYTSPPGEEPGFGTDQGRGTNEVYTYFVVKDSRVNRLYNGDTDNRLMVSYNNGTSFASEGWQWGGYYGDPAVTAPLPGDAATSIALTSDPNTIYVGVAAQAAFIQTEGNADGYQSGVMKGTYHPKNGQIVGHWDWNHRVGTLEAPPAGPSGGGPGGGIDILYDPVFSGKLFAAYFSHGLYKIDPGATSSTPWTNTDTGSNWTPAPPLHWYVNRIKQESTTGRLYVGAGNPLPLSTYVIPDGETGVWESNDSGNNWCRISTTGTQLDNDMGNEAVTDLLPMGPDGMLVATGVPVPLKYPIQSPPLAYADAAGNYTGEGGVYKGIRTGNCSWTWTRVMKQPKVTGLAVSPTDRSTVYAFVGQGHPGGLAVLPGQKAGIYRSDDEGVTWYAVVNDGLANLFHGWLNLSDNDPNTLYASTVGNGSFLGTRSCTNPITESASSPATCFDGLDNDCDGVVDYDCSFDATNQLLSSGSILSGASTDLKGRPDRDAAETIRESLKGSTKPLDVIWTFSGMPTGKVYYLNVEGFKASDANDTFTFKSTTKLSGTCNGNESGYTNRITLSNTVFNDTDVAQFASIGTVTSGSPVVCIRVQDSGVSDGHQDQITLDRVYLFPEPPEITATSDYQTVIGSISSGTFANTATSDDVRESLTEALDTTVSPQVSRLEHIWRFDGVPFGSSHQLNLEGNRVAGSDSPVDNFQFSYSTDGINFQDITSAIIDHLPESPGGGYFSFGPAGIGGTIYIRVKDTNTTSGTNLDAVNVDRIAIKTIP